ncbi:MAG: hypothetical protein ACRCYX_07850, partial [Dermatophilaceae bacterium]
AREMARALPEHTRCVVTLGSPFRGHPTSTRAWATYRLLNRGAFTESLFSEEARARRAEPLPVPTTCVYSRSDGIVAWQCCVSEPAPNTENVEVDGSHLGYGHHLGALRVIADRLAQPEGAWRPYSTDPQNSSAPKGSGAGTDAPESHPLPPARRGASADRRRRRNTDIDGSPGGARGRAG